MRRVVCGLFFISASTAFYFLGQGRQVEATPPLSAAETSRCDARLIDRNGRDEQTGDDKNGKQLSKDELLALAKVTENVYVVGRAGWGGFKPLSAGGSSNVFLLDGDTELALIDVGMKPGVDDVLKNIATLGFDTAKLTKVFLTHAHWDHSAALAEFQKRLPHLKTYGHKLCQETMADGSGIYRPEYNATLIGHINATITDVVQQGDSVQVGKIKVDVIALPGHTPDSTGYLIDQQLGRACFTGDTAIGDQGDKKGVVGWISNNWRSKLTHFANTCNKLSELKLAAIYPGHGLSHVGAEKCAESLANCKARLKQLMDIPHLGSMMPIDY